MHRLLATMVAGVVFALLTGYTMHEVDLPGVDWLLSFYRLRAALHRLRDGRGRQRDQHHRRLQRPRGRVAASSCSAPSPTSRTGSATTWSSRSRVLYARAGARLLPGQLPARQDLPRRRRRLFRRLPARRARRAAADAQPRDLGLDRDPDLRLPGDRDAGLDAAQGPARRATASASPTACTSTCWRTAATPGGWSRRARPLHLRNPATSLVTWVLPLLTAVFAAIAYDSAAASAFFFFVTVFIYGQLYRVMSLNAPKLPLGLARLL